VSRRKGHPLRYPFEWQIRIVCTCKVDGDTRLSVWTLRTDPEPPTLTVDGDDTPRRIQLQCPRCPHNVPLRWENAVRLAGEAYRAGISRIDLARLLV
jgi:hypothetical protein